MDKDGVERVARADLVRAKILFWRDPGVFSSPWLRSSEPSWPNFRERRRLRMRLQSCQDAYSLDFKVLEFLECRILAKAV